MVYIMINTQSFAWLEVYDSHFCRHCFIGYKFGDMKLNSCVISLIFFLIYIDLSATTQEVDELLSMGHFLLRSFTYLVNMASYFKIAFFRKKKKKKKTLLRSN
jgi:hypothetical protein